MSSDNNVNVYKRIFDLLAAIFKMVVDGVRDPNKVADALQDIVDTAMTYLKQIVVVNLAATDGIETFKSSGLFTGGIYGMAVPAAAQGKATAAMRATVWEIILDGIFAKFFGSLGASRRRWTEAQVVKFCRDHRDKLRTGGYATFFEMEGDVVAGVFFGDRGRLGVGVRPFSLDFVWDAERQRRLVSLQQAA